MHYVAPRHLKYICLLLLVFQKFLTAETYHEAEVVEKVKHWIYWSLFTQIIFDSVLSNIIKVLAKLKDLSMLIKNWQSYDALFLGAVIFSFSN